MPNFFSRILLVWHKENPRPLPWSDGLRNPYFIWLSEIIMQQTRVVQGSAYYLRFISKYPTVQDLASASLDDVMRSWEGLGYYTRARNLHKAANYIVHQIAGQFPDSYAGLLALPGVGPYSAAAISSFAFGLPYAVVDGNVKRVVSRFVGISDSIDEPKTHDRIQTITSGFMRGVEPALFNQSIMNFGALICKPKPLCDNCPLSKKCFAYQHNLVATIPVRTKKKELVQRYFHFIVIHSRGRILMRRNDEKDIWRGLFSFPFLEKKSMRSPDQKQLSAYVSDLTGQSNHRYVDADKSVYKQLLSHQIIYGRFHHFEVSASPVAKIDECLWVRIADVGNYGKPRMVVDYLAQDPKRKELKRLRFN